MFKKVKTACKCNLKEDPVDVLQIIGCQIRIDVRPHEIFTMKIVFDEN